MYLWVKALHIIFLVTWFAGLFYLPRLYVYHSMPEHKGAYQLFKVMERRLFIMMTIGGVLTAVFGIWLISLNTSVFAGGWFHAKLLFLALLIAYHIWCYRIMVTFRHDQNTRSHKWYRMFNEAPSFLLIVIVVLVVTKPF
ncbi:MAG: Protoporphyrinogen IX oxidase, novel form, HemJ (EC [uncultured Thiotrichaceae bacterium]|uniref:Protoporphyrinogen IX oxidase n=1 Tax=uncultured Thiotrichaceae bacterium TaxID=298394 RepID=A0A6S6SHM1_9GAMM|nr:MAG: Protoporphyrinogen IX oxidase, novel form, HemJ (EC [uncultured Thiotrichaceae bacterium]